MKPFQRNLGAIVGVNFQLLLASVFGVIAWVSWPQSPEWWGMGVGSFIFGLGTFAGVINALKTMGEIHTKERILAEYLAQGGKPKSARLASPDQLRNAGMIE